MFKTILRKLAGDEQGATAIEYGLLVAMIAIAAVAAMSKLGGSSKGGLQATADTISNAIAG
ncbi:MAG: Flp family type IVb pilin [Novosphingobium sp.]